MSITCAEYKDLIISFPGFFVFLFKREQYIQEIEEEEEEEPKGHNLRLVKIWHDKFGFKSNDIYDCDCSHCYIPPEIEKRKYRKKKEKKEEQD